MLNQQSVDNYAILTRSYIYIEKRKQINNVDRACFVIR